MGKKIIIGGCGSSGTTLLRKMLNAHSNIACGPEMSVFDRPKIFEVSLTWLYTMYRNRDFDSLDEGCVYPLRMQPLNSTYFGLSPDNSSKFYHSPDEIEAMFDQVETTRDFFDLFFTRYAEKNGANIWAEKTPNNIFCVDKVFEWFPDAVFVEVVRDGRDVVLSLNARRNNHAVVACWRWIAAVSAGQRYESTIWKNGSTYIRIYYEDLIKAPGIQLDRICRAVGEKFEPAMLEYWREPLPEDKDQKLDYGTQPIFENSIGKWKKEDCDPTIIEQMRLSISDKLKQLAFEAW